MISFVGEFVVVAMNFFWKSKFNIMNRTFFLLILGEKEQLKISQLKNVVQQLCNTLRQNESFYLDFDVQTTSLYGKRNKINYSVNAEVFRSCWFFHKKKRTSGSIL